MQARPLWKEEVVFQIEEVQSVTEVAQARWNQLSSGSSIFSSWEWVRASEHHEYSSPLHLIAQTTDGRDAGALPAFHTSFEGNLRYRPSDLFSRILPAELQSDERWFPSFIAGSRAGNRNDLLINRDGSAPDHRRTVAVLLQRLCDLAEERGTQGVFLMYLTRPDVEALMHALGKHVFVFFTDVEFTVPIPVGGTFKDYLAALPKKRRNSIRREIRHFEDSDACVTNEAFDSEACRTMAPLLANVQAKHGMPRPVEWLAKTLQQRSNAMREKSRVLFLRRNNRVVGFHLLYMHGPALYAGSIGFDYPLLSQFDHFNLAYYHAIQFALNEGYERLHLGVGFHETKFSRGGQPRPLWSALIRFDTILNSVADDIHRWNEHRIGSSLQLFNASSSHAVERSEWSCV